MKTQEKQRWVKKWQLRWEGDNAIVLISPGVFVDLAIRHCDGSIVYDFPERIPQYVKDAVSKMFEEDSA